MAVGNVNLGSGVRIDHARQVSRPVQITSFWQLMIAAGGMDDTDNSASRIRNADTQITAATRNLADTRGIGTLIQLQMAYDDSATTITTQAVIQVFGRSKQADGTGHWILLVNKDGEDEITMTATPNSDVTDGTSYFTAIDPDKHLLDLAGCSEVLVGVKTALAHSGGSAAAAFLNGRLL